MHLLHASSLSGPEFASLSLLLKPESSSAAASIPMGEPLITVSPMTTVSAKETQDVLKELHQHLASTLLLKGGKSKASADEKLAAAFYKEDERLLQQMQVFRPSSAHGLGLQYRLLRNDGKAVAVTNLATLILASSKSNASSAGPPPLTNVLGVVFCVGVSGLPYAHAPSPNGVSQRLNDCVSLLTRAKASDLAAIKVLLSTLLLSDEDALLSNDMVEGRSILKIADVDEGGEKKGAMGMMSPIGGIVKASKRMSVTQQKNAAANPNESSEVSVPLAVSASSAEATRVMTERLTVMSAAETDTFLRKYTATGHERKANLELTSGGGKSRFRSSRRKADGRDADFDNFDYKGEVKEKAAAKPKAGQPAKKAVKQQQQAIPALPAGEKLGLKQPKRDTRAKSGTSRRMSNQLGAEQAPSRKSNGMMDKDGKLDLFGGPKARNSHDDMTFVGDSTVASQARLQVNIALNEDLACSYRMSELSSCAVEGVVQVQVKSTNRSPIPFYLLIKDLSEHIESLQENKKFAEDVSDTLVEEEDDVMDYKFVLTIPKGDSYVPTLRYKCVQELRPVPIRVQTKIKADTGFCRVALQISSNPNNEATLTDLTIIMGVPDMVIGETLVSQPPGGVWNESKRSVIWCVSELGDGEKFQLQARFEVEGPVNPDFPVLVRSQCLFAQLSDLELEVRDMPDSHPADISMKLARRFRLSHRERS